MRLELFMNKTLLTLALAIAPCILGAAPLATQSDPVNEEDGQTLISGSAFTWCVNKPTLEERRNPCEPERFEQSSTQTNNNAHPEASVRGIDSQRLGFIHTAHDYRPESGLNGSCAPCAGSAVENTLPALGSF